MNPSETAANSDPSIDALLDRINKIADGNDPDSLPEPSEPSNESTNREKPNSAQLKMLGLTTPDGPQADYYPKAPEDLYEAGVSESMLEELVCKYLLAKGEASQRDITSQINRRPANRLSCAQSPALTTIGIGHCDRWIDNTKITIGYITDTGI